MVYKTVSFVDWIDSLTQDIDDFSENFSDSIFSEKSIVSRGESPFFRKKALSAEATELFSDFPGYKRKR